MRVGQVFETAECANCGRLVRHTYWGDGGSVWTHIDTDRTPCHPAVSAAPRAETICPVIGNGA